VAEKISFYKFLAQNETVIVNGLPDEMRHAYKYAMQQFQVIVLFSTQGLHHRRQLPTLWNASLSNRRTHSRINDDQFGRRQQTPCEWLEFNTPADKIYRVSKNDPACCFAKISITNGTFPAKFSTHVLNKDTHVDHFWCLISQYTVYQYKNFQPNACQVKFSTKTARETDSKAQ